MDLIDRKELIRQIQLQANRSSLGETTCRELTFGEVAGLIIDAPTVDAKPVNYGEWVAIPVNGAWKFRCSNIDCCRLIPSGCSPEELVYCPYCGAKMRGKNHDKYRS